MSGNEISDGEEFEIRTRSDLAELTERAMEAAAASVIEVSRRTGTPVIIWVDGQIKEIPVDQIEKRTKPPNPTE